MTPVLAVASWLLAALAACVVALNYLCVIASLRNTRLGIDRHHSVVPAVVLIACGVAMILSGGLGLPYPPRLVLALLVLLDPGLWVLIAAPFALIRRRR